MVSTPITSVNRYSPDILKNLKKELADIILAAVIQNRKQYGALKSLFALSLHLNNERNASLTVLHFIAVFDPAHGIYPYLKAVETAPYVAIHKYLLSKYLFSKISELNKTYSLITWTPLTLYDFIHGFEGKYELFTRLWQLYWMLPTFRNLPAPEPTDLIIGKLFPFPRKENLPHLHYSNFLKILLARYNLLDYYKIFPSLTEITHAFTFYYYLIWDTYQKIQSHQEFTSQTPLEKSLISLVTNKTIKEHLSLVPYFPPAFILFQNTIRQNF